MITKTKRPELSQFRVNNQGQIMRRYTPTIRAAIWDAIVLATALTLVAVVFLTLNAH